MDDGAAMLQDPGQMQQAEFYGKQILEQRRAALGDRHPLVLAMIGSRAFHWHIQTASDCTHLTVAVQVKLQHWSREMARSRRQRGFSKKW